jgi:Protein of unknown function (DUF2637)
MNEKVKVEKIISNSGWIVVTIAALSISTWSLYWLGTRQLKMPPVLAGMISACFDGGAIYFSAKSVQWAKIHGVSGLSSRMPMFLSAGLSAWFNYSHAILADLPYVARWLFAAPSIVGLLTIEAHLRFEYRTALKRSGALPKELPHYAKWAWIFRPFHTFRAMLWHIDRQLEEGTEGNANYEVISDTPHKIIRAWAIQEGRDVPLRGPLPADLIKEYMTRDLAIGNSSNGNSEVR